MSLAMAIGLVLVGLALSGFFSGCETGLYCVNRLRVRLGVERGDPAAQRLGRLIEDEQATLTVTLIGTNLMNYVTTAAFAYLLADHLGLTDRDTELCTIVILTPIVFVFGEVTPKNLFQLSADKLMRRGGRLLDWTGWLFRMTGAVKLLSLTARSVTRLVGTDPVKAAGFHPKRRFSFLLRDALVGDVAGDEQSELVERVVQLPLTPVHAVMVPHNRVTRISATANRKELISTARRTRRARIPVYQRHPRHIIGLIKIDNLLASDDWQQVSDHLRPVTQIGAHDPVSSAINTLQGSGHTMAIVVDRGGQMLGIVTLKDLLQEVVGELGAW
jgi:putative hemolysin